MLVGKAGALLRRRNHAITGKRPLSMSVVAALTLTNSWPIYEASWRLPIVGAGADAFPELEGEGIGQWSCRLSDEGLTWSEEVYRLFGIPAEERVTRSLARSLYLPHCRSSMEMLRAFSLRHNRGFTLDARIRRPDGDLRWMRLSAAPVLCEGRIVRLAGTKQDVTAKYDEGR
jgi:PAS domain S-box-containing protein